MEEGQDAFIRGPLGAGILRACLFGSLPSVGQKLLLPFFPRGEPDSARLIKWPRVTQPVSDRKQDLNPSLAPNLGSSQAVLCMGFGVDMRGWGAGAQLSSNWGSGQAWGDCQHATGWGGGR